MIYSYRKIYIYIDIQLFRLNRFHVKTDRFELIKFLKKNNQNRVSILLFSHSGQTNT